jgi:hypothetical protein
MLKDPSKLFGIIAFTAFIGFLLTGCSNPANGNDPPAPQTATYTSADESGNRYTLTVTENTDRSARYAAQTGDRFELKIELFNNGSYSLGLVYSGVIDSAATSGATITLNLAINETALHITISGTTMTMIATVNPAEEIPLNQGAYAGDTIPPPNTVTPVAPGPEPGPEPGEETELSGNITANTTLGRAGMLTTYVWNGDMLNVQNNATLTALPGVTIRFTQAGGGINVSNGGALIMQGAPVLLDAQGSPVMNGTNPVDGRITLKGGTAKGSWKGIEIHSAAGNVLDRVNILNAGNGSGAYSCAVYLYGGSASITNCVIDGSAGNVWYYSNGQTSEALPANNLTPETPLQ